MFTKVILAALTFIALVPAPVASTAECDICEAITGVAERWVAHNETEQVVEKYLDASCQLLPKSDVPICEQIIDTYYPEMVGYLVKEYPPGVVCSLMGLC